MLSAICLFWEERSRGQAQLLSYPIPDTPYYGVQPYYCKQVGREDAFGVPGRRIEPTRIRGLSVAGVQPLGGPGNSLFERDLGREAEVAGGLGRGKLLVEAEQKDGVAREQWPAS